MDKAMIDKLVDRDEPPMVPASLTKVPTEVRQILALGSRLSRLVCNSPIEPHIKALATEFIHRANKVTVDGR